MSLRPALGRVDCIRFQQGQSRSKRRWLRGGCICGWSLLSCALLTTGVLVALSFLLQAMLEAEIHDALLITSPESSGYTEWESNIYEDAVPLYLTFYMWNLTNEAQLRAGAEATPAYTRAGPYSYRKYRDKINVTFLDDGASASLSWWLYYVFDPATSVSGANPDTDLVTGVSPTYYKLAMDAGGEDALVVVFSAGVLGSSIAPLVQSVYPVAELSYETCTDLQAARTQIVADDFAGNETAFVLAWAQDDGQHPAPWKTVFGTIAATAGLTLAAAQQLWDANSAYSLSQCAGDPARSITLDYACAAGALGVYGALAGCTDPSAAIAAILQTLPAGTPQSAVEAVVQWRSQYASTQAQPPLLARFNVSSLAELGRLQYGGCSVAGGSMAQVYPQFGYSATVAPELGCYSGAVIPGWTLQNVASFLDPVVGFSNYTNIGYFLQNAAAGNVAALVARWPYLSAPTTSVAQVAGYLKQNVGDVYAAGSLKRNFEQDQTGLVATRSVTQWLWGFTDPLASKLAGETIVTRYYTNQTTREEAYAAVNNSVLNTGKDSFEDIGEYIAWQGLSVLPAGTVWASPVPVVGTEGDQFPPFLSKDDQLQVFSAEVMRTLFLNYDEEVTHHGVELYRFRLDENLFGVNSLYYQSLEGFANMSNINRNVPVFLSKPNFYEAPEIWRTLVTGLNPDADADDTIVDVEPFTGKAMRAGKRLQVNLHLNATKKAALFTRFFNWMPSDSTTGTMYPLFYVDENGEISKELAESFRNSVYLLVILSNLCFWGGLSLGTLLLFSSCTILLVVLWKNAPGTHDSPEEQPVFGGRNDPDYHGVRDYGWESDQSSVYGDQSSPFSIEPTGD